jgi:hypothetical protein
MMIFSSESFSWWWTACSSHPTHIVTSGLLTNFGAMTWGLLPVIIDAKLFMTTWEKQAASGRWLGVSEWIDQLYWVVHYFSWYEPTISAIHFIHFSTTNNSTDIGISKCQILYLDHLRLSRALNVIVTPRCAYYTSVIIKNFIRVDEMRLRSGHTRYGKCDVNQHIVLTISCYGNYMYEKATTFLLLSIT